MATGDIKTVYIADNTLTVTNLHSLAASSNYTAGWESPTIDHSSDGADDDFVGLHLVTHASNRQAGAIRVHGVAMINDSLWPNVFDGTESVKTWTDTEELDAAAILAKEIVVDNSASAVYDVIIPSMKAVFGGTLPKKYALFVTGNATTTTTAQLASSGSTVTVRSSYKNVAP